MKSVTVFLSIMFFSASSLISVFAQNPQWIINRPFSTEHFYGRGKGTTEEAAVLAGKQELLIQLSRQVIEALRQHQASSGDIQEVVEKTMAYIDSIELRSATVEDRVKVGQFHYALIRYPENSGLLIASSAVMQFETRHGVDSHDLIEQWDEGAMIKAARLERVLNDITHGDYGPDIRGTMRGNTLGIQVLNFDAYGTHLTENQQKGFDILGRILLGELQHMNHGEISVIGYANPVYVRGEQDILVRLSRKRAETVAALLRDAAIPVGEVRGLGGERLIGDTSTSQGKSLNRRVEIKVEVVR